MFSVVQCMQTCSRYTRSIPLLPFPSPLLPSPVDTEMVEVFAPPPSNPAKVPKASFDTRGRNVGPVLMAKDDPSPGLFDILNTFQRRWFLSQSHLLANALSAHKAEDVLISWVEFAPPFHSHLVKCALVLVPRPVPRVKRVMFAFILELLNQEGHLTFFKLQKGGHKANNTQKEKRCLARKHSCAAKREQDREAAKVAKLPEREQSCLVCGHMFQSRKTVKPQKVCSPFQSGSQGRGSCRQKGLHPTPPALVPKPPALITPLHPLFHHTLGLLPQ
jgi:hypothetical protein